MPDGLRKLYELALSGDDEDRVRFVRALSDAPSGMQPDGSFVCVSTPIGHATVSPIKTLSLRRKARVAMASGGVLHWMRPLGEAIAERERDRARNRALQRALIDARDAVAAAIATRVARLVPWRESDQHKAGRVYVRDWDGNGSPFDVRRGVAMYDGQLASWPSVVTALASRDRVSTRCWVCGAHAEGLSRARGDGWQPHTHLRALAGVTCVCAKCRYLADVPSGVQSSVQRFGGALIAWGTSKANAQWRLWAVVTVPPGTGGAAPMVAAALALPGWRLRGVVLSTACEYWLLVRAI